MIVTTKNRVAWEVMAKLLGHSTHNIGRGFELLANSSSLSTGGWYQGLGAIGQSHGEWMEWWNKHWRGKWYIGIRGPGK